MTDCEDLCTGISVLLINFTTLMLNEDQVLYMCVSMCTVQKARLLYLLVFLSASHNMENNSQILNSKALQKPDLS